MVTYTDLYLYVGKKYPIKRNDFKQLIKDAGIRLRDKNTRWYPKWQSFTMDSVEKILALRYQRLGAKEIRKRRRELKRQLPS